MGGKTHLSSRSSNGERRGRTVDLDRCVRATGRILNGSLSILRDDGRKQERGDHRHSYEHFGGRASGRSRENEVAGRVAEERFESRTFHERTNLIRKDCEKVSIEKRLTKT